MELNIAPYVPRSTTMTKTNVDFINFMSTTPATVKMIIYLITVLWYVSSNIILYYIHYVGRIVIHQRRMKAIYYDVLDKLQTQNIKRETETENREDPQSIC